MGSDRSFGFVFTVFFILVGVWPLIGGGIPRWWSLVLALVFLAAATTRPRILRPLNIVWFKIGQAMHRVVSPIVMGLLFFGVITPIGLLMRASGVDPLGLKRDAATRSFWVERDPPGPTPESMKNQF